jgi:hypothetical protein
MKWKTILVFILVIFLNAKLSFGANWKVIADSAAGLYYYDADSVKKVKTGVRIWTKIVFSKEGKRDFIKIAGKDFTNTSYLLHYVELNCDERIAKFLSLKVYSETKCLHQEDFSEPQFVAPGTPLDILINFLCR